LNLKVSIGCLFLFLYLISYPKMKKKIVLFILFILPLACYLFFASGINHFGKLPMITKQVPDFGNWKSMNNEKVTLNNKITILSFPGKDLIKNQGNYFNLTEQIYNKNKTFTDFQFVLVVPDSSEKEARELMVKLGGITDVSGWHVLFTSDGELRTFYDNLKLKGKLDQFLGSKFAHIIDKKRNLRGRNDKKDYKEGYNSFSPSDLHNEMNDDVKIILAEYRFALKINNNKLKPLEKKKLE
jgi:hypothetical protein